MADTQRSVGADLLKAVCAAEGTGNVTVSPASAALAVLTQLQVSHHLYSAPGNPPEQQTLDDLATGFGSRLAQLDFSSPTATDAINTDVRKDTRGLIPTLFDRPLDRSTVAVLTNVLHLKADWVTPFAAMADAPFTTDSGTTATAHLMSQAAPDAPYRSSGHRHPPGAGTGG